MAGRRSGRPLARMLRTQPLDDPDMPLEEYLARTDLLIAGCTPFPPHRGDELAHAATAAHLRHFLTVDDFETFESPRLFAGGWLVEGWWQ